MMGVAGRRSRGDGDGGGGSDGGGSGGGGGGGGRWGPERTNQDKRAPACLPLSVCTQS